MGMRGPQTSDPGPRCQPEAGAPLLADVARSGVLQTLTTRASSSPPHPPALPASRSSAEHSSAHPTPDAAAASVATSGRAARCCTQRSLPQQPPAPDPQAAIAHTNPYSSDACAIRNPADPE